MAILDFVDSLRSGLARNAIVCIGDMFKYLPKYMETQLDFVVFLCCFLKPKKKCPKKKGSKTHEEILRSKQFLSKRG